MSSYVCPKCGHTACTTDEISTTGAGLTKFLDIQNRKFTVISCSKCQYAEFYKGTSSELSNILDFLT